MWWTLFQLVIVFAVVGSDIHWKWTDNPVVVGLAAFAASWAATWLIVHRGNWRNELFRNTPQRLPPNVLKAGHEGVPRQGPVSLQQRHELVRDQVGGDRISPRRGTTPPHHL